ncbi:hypothetical protein AB0E44_09325 [Micrococcus terreus]|uniref:hypothetical protein n=1 Tax=Micrococcus terreus TaxID=574650 RepID=UPI0033F5026E
MMTTKPPPLSELTIRPGKITIRQYRSARLGRWWTLSDWRPDGEVRNYLNADTFQECLDRLREIEAREMAERVTMESAA